ncbi:MAG TPA: protein kinase, partial [Blastocatellia bacterium]|nr:protein kinase [Blastocatellia bacterium]
MDESANGGQREAVVAEQWRKIKTLFEAALQCEAGERPAFLASIRDEDPQVRAQLEQLLRDYEEAVDFLEEPLIVSAAAIVAAADEGPQAIGRMIGPYRVIRLIGRGGMSAVYLSERADDVYRKQVAIKLIWPGLITDEIERRFRQERRILARLDHPHIGRLLDGGVTADGWQYVVMEYVPGLPITQYSDSRQLSITERLRLFQQVCAAVEYAHGHLVVHRDLKPSNILVTNDGTVKLLDFGIAKLLAPALLELDAGDLPPTQPGVQAMTLEYASPEQMHGENITTASDVYSLGVVLYELLTGHRPYQLQSRMPHEAARIISEHEPPSPSVVIHQAAPLAAELGRRLQGDLDAIVLKALRQEPLHRYHSANDLSEDLARHLRGDPVAARQGTMIYLTTKYLKRHKAGVSIAGLVFLMLLGSIGYLMRQARVAEAQAHQQLRLLYAADMRQAGNDLLDKNLERAGELVERYRSGFSSPRAEDWRGFEWYFLWNALHTEQWRLQHEAIVGELAITPDGKRLLIGSRAGNIEKWNLDTRRPEGLFASLGEEIRGLALSRDGKRLAAGGATGLARVWDVASGKMIFEQRGHGDRRVYTVALSPDGRTLVTGGGDAAARLWRIDSGELRQTFAFAGTKVRTVQFSPDGQSLAIGGTGDSTIRLFNLKTFQPSAVLRGSTDDILHSSFSGDGKLLAAGTRDGYVRVWDLESRELRQSYPGHQGLVWSVGFSPDGKTIVSAGEDRTIRFWDRETGREAARVDCEFEIDTVLFQPDPSRTSVFCTIGDTTRSFDLGRLELPLVITDLSNSGVAISPDGTTFAVVDAFGTLTHWDAATGRLLTTIRRPQYSFQRVVFSPDGRSIAVTGRFQDREAVAELRDAGTGRILATLRGHHKEVSSTAFSPDGRTLATGGEDHLIKLWDAATGRERLTIEGHHGEVITVDFSPDGNRLVSAGLDSRARVWDVKTGAQLLEFPALATARYSPDGKLIATGSHHHLVKLWEAATGREIRVLRGHSGDPRTVAFSPDGKRLVSAGEDQTIRIWDPATGLELLALKGHQGAI